MSYIRHHVISLDSRVEPPVETVEVSRTDLKTAEFDAALLRWVKHCKVWVVSDVEEVARERAA